MGERFDRERLGEAGHAFEEDVAVGQQPDHESLDEIILANDDAAQFVEKRVHKRAGFLHRFVNGIDSCAHVFRILQTDGQQGQPVCSEKVRP